MVDQPRGCAASQHLEAAAIGNQPLVFLYQHNGFTQGGGRLQGKADHIDAGRAHAGSYLQAKARVSRAVFGGSP